MRHQKMELSRKQGTFRDLTIVLLHSLPEKLNEWGRLKMKAATLSGRDEDVSQEF